MKAVHLRFNAMPIAVVKALKLEQSEEYKAWVHRERVLQPKHLDATDPCFDHYFNTLRGK